MTIAVGVIIGLLLGLTRASGGIYYRTFAHSVRRHGHQSGSVISLIARTLIRTNT